MTDKNQSADLDATIALLQHSLAEIDPDQAIAAIEAWQQQLQGTGMAETLGELKLAIDGGIRSGEIGSILSDLGTQTLSAAGEAEDGSKLQQLGQLLSSAMK